MTEATHGKSCAERLFSRIVTLSSPFTMFRKSLAKAVPPRALLQLQRSFSTTLPARKVTATNPVKAQEVKVLSLHHLFKLSSPSLRQSWSSGKYPLIEHEYDAIVV